MLLNYASSQYDIPINILETQNDITSNIIINRLLEEYRKFLMARLEKILMTMLINQEDKKANQKGGKSKNTKTKTKFDDNCYHCNRQNHKKNQY